MEDESHPQPNEENYSQADESAQAQDVAQRQLDKGKTGEPVPVPIDDTRAKKEASDEAD